MQSSGKPEKLSMARMFDEIFAGTQSAEVEIIGEGSLPAAFPVTEFATASIAAAGHGVSEILSLETSTPQAVTVDRRLASMWFASSLRAEGWGLPPVWDAIAGDYRTLDGWIRLHTNIPAHRTATLGVLSVPADRQTVATAVARWRASELEGAVVAAGGCAATMQTLAQWDASTPGQAVSAEPLIAWSDTGQAPERSWQLRSEQPLSGVRVLDLTRVLAGPVATRFLAQAGAEVLRIDPPWWDEPGLVPEVMMGKRTVRLDVRENEGRERMLDLLTHADILVHGYRPGALDGLGLGATVRRDVAPGLVEVSLNAYGQTGPWAGRRGFDSLVQMSTGIADAGMRGSGTDRPTPLPVQALDHATGYLMAFAALRGISERIRTGQGRSAALSLARTARLLTGQAASELENPLRDEDERDVAPRIEETTWGPARRLQPPLKVGSVDFQTARPARALGSDSDASFDRETAKRTQPHGNASAQD